MFALNLKLHLWRDNLLCKNGMNCIFRWLLGKKKKGFIWEVFCLCPVFFSSTFFPFSSTCKSFRSDSSTIVRTHLRLHLYTHLLSWPGFLAMRVCACISNSEIQYNCHTNISTFNLISTIPHASLTPDPDYWKGKLCNRDRFRNYYHPQIILLPRPKNKFVIFRPTATLFRFKKTLPVPVQNRDCMAWYLAGFEAGYSSCSKYWFPRSDISALLIFCRCTTFDRHQRVKGCIDMQWQPLSFHVLWLCYYPRSPAWKSQNTKKAEGPSHVGFHRDSRERVRLP